MPMLLPLNNLLWEAKIPKLFKSSLNYTLNFLNIFVIIQEEACLYSYLATKLYKPVNLLNNQL